MITLSHVLILISVAIMFFNIAQYLVSGILRADSMLKITKKSIPFSIVIFLVMILTSVMFLYIFTMRYVDPIVGITIFLSTIVLTSFSVGTFSRYKIVKERTQKLVKALIGVIEAGDENLDGHSLYVMELSMLIYENLPFRRKCSLNLDSLQYAALLFDVGKLGVPRNIIDKKGKLEPSEWEFIRRHPEIGAMILQEIPSFGEVSTWIKYHHERVDGTGYYKLKGREIPLASRIIAVADTYSALTMNRNYKFSRSYQEAVLELKLAAGTQLDSHIVDLFCSIPEYKIESCLEDVRKTMQRYLKENFR